jgi:hypothetical protein
MTITLPDEMKDELERKAHLAGFASVDQYVLHALRFQSDEGVEKLQTMPVPEELVIKSLDDLEAKIQDGFTSGAAIRATPELWDNLRRRAESQVTRQKPQS